MAEAVARRRWAAPRGFSATSFGATSLRALAVLALLPVAAGCSVKRIAVRTVADAMASGADVYATDDDPELVGAALPFGLKTIEAKGQPFDPNFHQAVSTVLTNDVPENTVVEEMRRGYTLNGRLLRAAMVSVSAAA